MQKYYQDSDHSYHCGMTYSPQAANRHRALNAFLSCGNSAYRNDMVRVGSMTHAEEKSQD
jgi:hypothetical protein